MSIINAGNTTTTAFKITADTSGNVVLQSNGTNVATINAAVSEFYSNVSVSGITTLSSNVSALGNVAVTGSVSVGSNVSVTGNATFSSLVAVPAAGIQFSDGSIQTSASSGSAVAGAVNVTLQQGYGGF